MHCRNPHSLAYQVAIATTDIYKYSLSQKLGLRLAHNCNNCECRDIKTVIYKFTIALFTIPAQSEQELYMWTEHACKLSKKPSTCERVRYVWTGPPIDIGHSTCERDYSPWQCLKACNTLPFHIPWHTSPGQIIYHAMSTWPYRKPCDARQAIEYTMPWPPGHTIYHTEPSRPYHPLSIARQAIPYTMSCPPGHTIYYAKPMQCLSGHLHHAMPARPDYTMRCPQGHTVSHARLNRPYQNTMRCPPGHTIYQRGPQCHTVHYAMPARPYHIP